MRSSQVGLFLGAILGLAVIGWIVARVVEGDLDLNDLLSGGRRDRPQSGR
jgi:hypothetical protein